MRSPTHDFYQQRERHLELNASTFVALVDLDSYPGFIAETADRLDLLQHICHEMEALTATMWEVPEGMIRLHVVWTADNTIDDRHLHGCRQALANGVVRTNGDLCLANDEHLLAQARHRAGDLLRIGGKNPPQALTVPPGIYSIAVFGDARVQAQDPIQYTVLLVHHAHPGPRLQPVRLNGSMPFGRASLGHPAASPDWCDSHKMPR